MMRRSAPSDARVASAWARYWRAPLTRMPTAVTPTKAAPSRQPSRRHTGRRRPRGGGTDVAVGWSTMSRLLLPVDGQLGHVTLEEELHRPVEDHADACREGRELQHVDRLPEEPRRKADEPEPHEVSHRRPARERHHLAEELEAERRPRAASQRRLELPGERPALADRHLRGRDVGLPGVAIDLGRVVPERVETRPARHLEELVDEDPAVL